jgi:hypothetical protein
MGKERDGIWLSGIGSDIFGERASARLLHTDKANDYLMTMYLTQYFQRARQTGNLHKDFETDLNRLWYADKFYKPLYGLIGVVFAGIIFNPNYTSRHSFYLRKFTPIFFGTLGY